MTARESPTVDGRKPNVYYGYIIVVCAFIIMTTIWSAFNAYGVFFKPMMAEFGWTRAMTSSGFSLALLVSGVLGAIYPALIAASKDPLLALAYE